MQSNSFAKEDKIIGTKETKKYITHKAGYILYFSLHMCTSIFCCASWRRSHFKCSQTHILRVRQNNRNERDKMIPI